LFSSPGKTAAQKYTFLLKPKNMAGFFQIFVFQSLRMTPLFLRRGYLTENKKLLLLVHFSEAEIILFNHR